MRSEAMRRLDVLTGDWDVTMRDAWFLGPEEQPVPGRAKIEWLADAFVVVRWTMGGDVGPATSEMVLALGRSDVRDAHAALYHDERGVSRVLDMTFDPAGSASGAARWVLTREDPDMFQRFVADVTTDRIAGRWEASDDRGSTWRKDFDLIFERTSNGA
ncbi:hypothetical protein [Isoptericola sp. BMS4]|uniref:hypothetical protein n=1 Tax=Isoptericola sp. BMS4 TaxID=2527875 RepID=UPI00141FE2D0|nr:hypothetical protein [Isoptericola sp. BMS4]